VPRSNSSTLTGQGALGCGYGDLAFGISSSSYVLDMRTKMPKGQLEIWVWLSGLRANPEVETQEQII